MPLVTGDRLGSYEIVALLGRGGMGEVWRAHDAQLGRDVAIKVSAQQFTDRFEREARAIAALNHPNICTLYHIGPNYLVLEYIEGPTLAERIKEGPIPLEEALGIAKQIADALEAAHEKGIVHRDLKPANVKIRPDGSVKVLDFGLAKAAGEEVELTSDSPTMMPGTQMGMVLGTAGYMSPEQARGKKADKRADIWAFGVVLYEMVTGKQLFGGETVSDSLAAIIKERPDLAVAPEKIRRLLARCLEKDPKKRLRDIGDAMPLLDEPASIAPSRSRFGVMGWIAAGAFALVAAALGFVHSREKPAVVHVTRFVYPLPEGQDFTRAGRHVIAISPDGTKLAYVANQQLYVRAMDQLEAQPVPGTNEDPMEPVFSPDGQWLAYFVPGAGTLFSASFKKIAVAGGAPVTLGRSVGAPYGVTWRDGTIAFGVNTGGGGIQAVADSGGTVRTLATIDPKKERLVEPQLLADGKHLLFVSLPSGTNEGQIVVQTLNGKDRRTLVSGGTDPRVLPSGQLVYLHDGTLLAVPFDTKRLAVTGGPIPLVEGITEASTSVGQFAISSDGTLAFIRGSSNQRRLVWVDREGHEQPIPAKPRQYVYPRLSPDGTRIAVSSRDEEADIWVFDLAKETLTRLTFGPTFDDYPLWTSDNSLLYVSSSSSVGVGVPDDIFRKAADGAGTTEALTHDLEGGYPLSLTPDGKLLVCRSPITESLFVLPLDPKGQARVLFANSGFVEYNSQLSPDGRWIVYDSNESGRFEIYVRPFPAVDSGRWQISTEGGSRPLWSRSGRELFFLTPSNRMATVPVPVGASFTYGKPQLLFDASAYFFSSNIRTFDISADGKRFLMIQDAINGDSARPSIVVVSHWFDEVKARMPAQR